MNTVRDPIKQRDFWYLYRVTAASPPSLWQPKAGRSASGAMRASVTWSATAKATGTSRIAWWTPLWI
jgi:hypothetical protein